MSESTSGTEPQRIVIIDGHAMAFRAYFALPPESFVNGQGQATNAVYGFTRMIFNIVKNEQPTHIAVAFDLPGGTFRDRIYDQYKAGRDATPEPFKGQIALIQQVLDALGVSWWTVEDFEADDIVASIATIADAAGVQPLLVTSDRDAIQLVSDTVTLLQPVKGVTEMRRMTPAAVEEKYLVSPAQYPELAALVGESADNLPGVPGVGPKTAAKWLGQFGSLEALFERADEIGGKAGQSFRDHLEAVRRNRQMNAAVRDLDLPTDFSAYALGRGDRVQINARFDDLAFGPTIRRDIPAALVSSDSPELPEEPITANPTVPVLTPGVGELELALGTHAATGGAIVAEGAYVAGLARLDALAVATSSATIIVDLGQLADEGDDMAALRRWCRNSVIPKSAADTKLAAHLLGAIDAEVRGWTLDLSLAEFLCRPDQRPADVAGLAMRHLREDLEHADGAAQGALDLDAEASTAALVARARAVWRMGPLLEADLDAHASRAIHDDLELPLASVIGRMESAGIQVSADQLGTLDAAHAESQQRVAEEAFSHIGGEPINLGSPKQLQTVLFERLGMPPTRKTKTGFSTDAESLSDLFVKTGHPFLSSLLAHRDVTKLRQIIETLRKSVSADGRIHTTLAQNVAATGRLASSNPNLQNIPARTEAGRQIRGAFGTSEGYESLLTADYSQIEMRIMAHLSGDEGLIHAFREGEDLHNFVASQVFGTPVDQVTSEERAKTKAVSYGLAYGLSAFGLARQLHIPQADATALRDQYFERFGGVRDYLRESVERAREAGYTETLLGRRRYLPDLTSDNRQRRENAERVALNSPIQGSAADIIKLAMLRVDARLRAAGAASRLLLQVHDELIVEVAPGEGEAVTALVREGMEGAYALDVPMDVSVGRGVTWLEAAH
ncbi:MAG: DNA polymerase I [Dermabacter sp.]|nr:DNA polymerase I [Dermabacter sp.]